LNKISLYDIKGAKIDEFYQGIPEQETVDIDYRIKDLARGVYIICLEDESGTQSRKIVID
jgi:hypothetical protein